MNVEQPSRARTLSAALATLAIVGGLVTFSGWTFGIVRFMDWFDLGVTMKANPAVTTVLLGSALLLTAVRPQALLPIRTLALAAALIGAATLSQHVVGWNLGIDTLLFDEPSGELATAAPGRMGPPASTGFLLLGLALSLLSIGRRRIAVGCALLVMALTILSVVGYLYGAEAMYLLPRLTGISLQMSLMLLALSVGTIAVVPDTGPMKVLSGRDHASVLAWRLLPTVVAVPLATGWLRLLGERDGLYDPAFGSALRTLVEMTLLLALSWWAVRAIRAREWELRRADRRKDEFIATLAHELRNPLAPIRQASLLARKPGLDDAQRLWCNEVIERQMQHMSLLLEDLLDVSRITRGTLSLRKAVSPIQDIVQAAVEAARPQIDARGHSLDIDMPATQPMVDVDALRMAQVIANLLSNAAKYTDPGGAIRLRIYDADGTLHIEVTDTGIGIAPEDVPEIFRMFGQIKDGQERTQGGLGIGLALSKGLVELHGGTIAVHSAGRGAGSRFSIAIPGVIVGTALGGRAVQVKPAAAVRSRKVLVADDNVDAAESLAMLLRADGHEVRVAHDGASAVRLAGEFSPDVALLDIGMPGMTGHDVARAIRRREAPDCPLLVAITGWGQQIDRERSAEAGFDHHLTKPVAYGELIMLLQSAGERHGVEARTLVSSG